MDGVLNADSSVVPSVVLNQIELDSILVEGCDGLSVATMDLVVECEV